MSHETSEQETDRSPETAKEERLKELLSIFDEWKAIIQKREVFATNRYDNILRNIRELEGSKEHRITKIILRYLQHVTFDSIILLRFTSELFDFAEYSVEDRVKLKEHFAEEVAPEIVKKLAKLQKLTIETGEDNEELTGPDNRLFG